MQENQLKTQGNWILFIYGEYFAEIGFAKIQTAAKIPPFANPESKYAQTFYSKGEEGEGGE